MGIGIDMVELAAVDAIRYKRRFAEYFLTPQEVAAMPRGERRVEFLASRFALKESVIKAFPKALTPHDFMIEKRDRRPQVVFLQKELNDTYSVIASITHTEHVAAAVVLVVTAET